MSSGEGQRERERKREALLLENLRTKLTEERHAEE